MHNRFSVVHLNDYFSLFSNLDCYSILKSKITYNSLQLTLKKKLQMENGYTLLLYESSDLSTFMNKN